MIVSVYLTPVQLDPGFPAVSDLVFHTIACPQFEVLTIRLRYGSLMEVQPQQPGSHYRKCAMPVMLLFVKTLWY